MVRGDIVQFAHHRFLHPDLLIPLKFVQIRDKSGDIFLAKKVLVIEDFGQQAGKVAVHSTIYLLVKQAGPAGLAIPENVDIGENFLSDTPVEILFSDEKFTEKMEMFAGPELVEMKIGTGTMAGSGSGIMESYLVLPALGGGYQVVAFQHLALNNLKSLLPPLFLPIFQGLLPDLLGGQEVILREVGFLLHILSSTLLVKELKENGHDMFAATSRIRAITMAGDRPVHANLRAVVAVIAIDLIHLSTVVAEFWNTAKSPDSL